VLTAGTAGPETAANKKGAVKSAAGAKKTNASKSATPTKSSAKKIKGTQRPKR
jgi:hypothetical protein